MFSDSSFGDMSDESARKIATMQAKLDKKLGPEYISQRPGPGGGPKLTYAEGEFVILHTLPHLMCGLLYLRMEDHQFG